MAYYEHFYFFCIRIEHSNKVSNKKKKLIIVIFFNFTIGIILLSEWKSFGESYIQYYSLVRVIS